MLDVHLEIHAILNLEKIDCVKICIEYEFKVYHYHKGYFKEISLFNSQDNEQYLEKLLEENLKIFYI